MTDTYIYKASDGKLGYGICVDCSRNADATFL